MARRRVGPSDQVCLLTIRSYKILLYDRRTSNPCSGRSRSSGASRSKVRSKSKETCKRLPEQESASLLWLQNTRSDRRPLAMHSLQVRLADASDSPWLIGDSCNLLIIASELQRSCGTERQDDMTSWRTIWRAYRNQSNVRNVVHAVVEHATWSQALILGLSFLALVLTLLRFIQQSVTERSVGVLLAIVALEVIFLWQWDKTKGSLRSSEWGGEASQTPPDTQLHRDSRYLLFKKTLTEARITTRHVEDCLPLAQWQIDMATSRGIVASKFGIFSLGALSSALVARWTELPGALFLNLWMLAAIVAAIAYFMLGLYPSHLERCKELHYFMMLYCREPSAKVRARRTYGLRT